MTENNMLNHSDLIFILTLLDDYLEKCEDDYKKYTQKLIKYFENKLEIIEEEDKKINKK